MQSISDSENASKSGGLRQSTADSSNVVWQGYELATWVQRLAAHLIDFLLAAGSLVVGLLGLATTLMAGSAGAELFKHPDHFWIRELFDGKVGWWLLLVGAAAMLSFLVWYTVTLGSGQTPGKMIVGIQVLRESGESSGWSHTFVREVILKGLIGHFLAIITLGLFLVVDFLWPLWDQQRQTLHDKMAETLVVQARPVQHSVADKPPGAPQG